MDKSKKTITFDQEFWKWTKRFGYLVIFICLIPIIVTKSPLYIQFPANSNNIGDTIGGIMGPFVGLAAAALTFLAFWIQYKANEQQKLDLEDQKAQYSSERVETRFFEMVKICRDNINDMKYEKYSKTIQKPVVHEGRRVPVIIFREIIECLRDIEFFFWSDNLDYYVSSQYKKTLHKISEQNNLKATIVDMIKIDIAYHITYFGLGTEGRTSVEYNLKNKYQPIFYGPLLGFIACKPKLEDLENIKIWNEIMERIEFNKKHLKHMDPETVFTSTISDIDEKIDTLKLTNPYYKYYGGHQHRLGHYFRHLFNSYVFLDSRKEISSEDKYLLSKLFRAQLSTYEQALILVNSISSLGMSWEYQPKEELQVEYSFSKGRLISTYNLITNLPGEHLNGIKYKDFYPEVEYEFDAS